MRQDHDWHEQSVANRATRFQHDDWNIPASIVDRIAALLPDDWFD